MNLGKKKLNAWDECSKLLSHGKVNVKASLSKGGANCTHTARGKRRLSLAVRSKVLLNMSEALFWIVLSSVMGLYCVYKRLAFYSIRPLVQSSFSQWHMFFLSETKFRCNTNTLNVFNTLRIVNSFVIVLNKTNGCDTIE